MTNVLIPFLAAQAELASVGCIPQAMAEPPVVLEEPTEAYEPDDPPLWLYRERTVALLKRYLRLSVEVGRLPSLLGREFFRTRVTHYRVGTFEDAVIFVHDVDRSLGRLNEQERKLLAIIVFQEHTHDEAARRMRLWRRTLSRRYHMALDQLSEIFLEGGLLVRLPQVESRRETESAETCQEGENDDFSVSDSADSK
jgi:DNA-directed RNA polymerase specialized sigma24 family protein